MRSISLVIMTTVLISCGSEETNLKKITSKPGLEGALYRLEAFSSSHVISRNVDVWLPPSYDEGEQNYPVLYFHDGQNLFYPEVAYGNQEWDVDRVLSDLLNEGSVPEMIVVGIWNSPKRTNEYFPEDATSFIPDSVLSAIVSENGPPLGNEYLSFMVEELKPWVDQNFRTKTGKENTWVMGSSMGGLISMYAVIKHPEVFSKAICVSTHWPASPNAILSWFTEALPEAGGSYLYFDYGTEGLDAQYEPFQLRANEILKNKGYVQQQSFDSFRFDGADHNEVSWNRRLPFIFKTVFSK